MITKNIFLSLLTGLTVAAFAANFSPVFAADFCTTQYGGTQTCQATDLLINKQVRSPNGDIVENLGFDQSFAPGSDILFQLTIKNASGQTFDPVVVKDVFPLYLTFVSGPGTYDSGSRTLTFTLNNLIAGETRNVQVTAKVLPTTASSVCVANYAEARADTVGRSDSDTAQFCIKTTNVLGVTTLPVAGYNDFLLLLPFAGVGLTGIALLKKKS